MFNTLILLYSSVEISPCSNKDCVSFWAILYSKSFCMASFVILRADTSMEEGMLLVTCILLTSKSVIDITLMTAVFSILISIGKKCLIAISTDTLIPCLSIYLIHMAIPPFVSTAIWAESFFLSSNRLRNWLPAKFTNTQISLIFFCFCNTIASAKTFNGIFRNIHSLGYFCIAYPFFS